MILKVKMWLAVSIVTILICLGIITVFRPVWGMDFTGGSLLEISTNDANIDNVRALLEAETDLSFVIQPGENQRLTIKSSPLNDEIHQKILSALRRENILQEELRYESIGPTIGQELKRKSLIALVLVLIMIIIYLAVTFRQVSGFIASWKFGLAAIYALIHDLLIMLAAFVLFGKFFSVPIDTLFVTAMLTILGYSVNDTIVIFNRLKSEWLATRSGTLLTILDSAVKKTLIRSLNTAFGALLVLISLLLFGGGTLRWFIAALTVGIVAGTYSSIFIAPPALYFLAKAKK